MSHFIKMQTHVHVEALTNFTLSAELNTATGGVLQQPHLNSFTRERAIW